MKCMLYCNGYNICFFELYLNDCDKESTMEIEKKLLLDVENLHVIIQNAPVMINSFDNNGRCLIWNKKSQEILGWTKEDFLSHVNPLALVYPSEEMRNKVLVNIKNADRVFRTYTVLAKDGSERIQAWADYRLPNGMLMGFGIDVTEQRQAEEMIRKQEERFRAFIKAIPDILFVFDNEGRYVEIFTNSTDLLVDDMRCLKTKRISDVLPEPLAKQHLAMINKTLDTQQSQRFEYELAVPKGTCWFENRTAPIRGLKDGSNLVASTVRDITRRKVAEAEAREKEKLAGVIETAGAVCHELNQPLQIIAGCCELLDQEEGLDKGIQRKVEIILREVKRMGKLNRNLMNITAYKTKSYLESKIIDIEQASEISSPHDLP